MGAFFVYNKNKKRNNQYHHTTMILLENYNRIVKETLDQRIGAKKHEVIDIVCADFDGVQFHLTTSKDAKNLLNVSIQWSCISQLLKEGADVMLKHEYGDLVQATPETGYDVTLQVNLDDTANKDKVSNSVSLLKRNLLSAPFSKMFQAIEKGQSPAIAKVDFRDGESLYIKPEGERAIVVFQVEFKDPNDQVLAKVFMQEFRRSVGGAPSVDYRANEAPLEVQGQPGLREGEGIGFISFVLMPAHIQAAKRQKTIDLMQMFRNYLQYHIKCSKADLHTRMRRRVADLLQVLNRAKPEPFEKKEKKVMGGKTFKRS